MKMKMKIKMDGMEETAYICYGNKDNRDHSTEVFRPAFFPYFRWVEFNGVSKIQ